MGTDIGTGVIVVVVEFILAYLLYKLLQWLGVIR